MEEQIQAQGFTDIFKILNIENIEKINEILKALKIEKTEDGTKISIVVK